MAAVAGGYSNDFVPQIEASDALRIRYFRPSSAFPLSKYTKTIGVKKSIGYYPMITTEEAGRATDANLNDDLWPDGDDAPSDEGNMESFELKQFNTVRRVRGYRIGAVAVEQAEWDVIADASAIHMQNRMTRRTMLAVAKLTNAALYGSNTATVASLTGGGNWGNGTTSNPTIRNSINKAIYEIAKATLSAADVDGLKLVLSPTLAIAISSTPEIIDMVKQSPTAIDVVTGEGHFKGNNRYLLPRYISGVEVVIEDTIKVTSKKGEARAVAPVWPDATAALVWRGGNEPSEDKMQGDGKEDAKIRFDSMQIFERRGSSNPADNALTIETWFDKKNRIHRGRITDDMVATFVAPASSFLFTACLTG